MTTRRQPKPAASRFHGSGYYVRQIIKCLEKVSFRSGYSAYQTYSDWTQLVEVCLEALPAHVRSIAQTGRLAEDTPETKLLFENIRSRYQAPPYRSSSADVWSNFSQAFALLLESAEPGLWGPGSFGTNDVDYIGPDVLGQILMEYTQPDPSKGQFLTPWPVVRLMSQLSPGGASLVYDRLKQACQQPDNILAQAALLAGLAIEEPAQAQEWFISRLVPLAMPYVEIVKVCDPAVGTGRMLMGLATQFEPWMVQLGLVRFFGQDIDPLMVRLTKINCGLYGLNTYGLSLTVALAEGLAERDQKPVIITPGPPVTMLAKAAEIHKNGKNGASAPAVSGAGSSFEALFRRSVEPVTTPSPELIVV